MSHPTYKEVLEKLLIRLHQDHVMMKECMEDPSCKGEWEFHKFGYSLLQSIFTDLAPDVAALYPD